MEKIIKKLHKNKLLSFTAIAAVTLDGRIAKNSGHNSNWTSAEDKKFMRSRLNKSDLVIVGNSTYKVAKKSLLKRNCMVLTKSVIRPRVISENLIYFNPKHTSLKRFLAKYNYSKIAVLGGAKTYTYMLNLGLINELYLTIEPLVFGQGLPLFAGKSKTKKFKLKSIKKLNSRGTVILHYTMT